MKGNQAGHPNLEPQSLVQRLCAITQMREEHRAAINTTLEQCKVMPSEVKKYILRPLEGKKPRYVLTAHGIVYIAQLMGELARCHKGRYCGIDECQCREQAQLLKSEFEDITPEIVKDLGKVDWVGRVALLFQASWMVIQTIARYCNHLPISLLELHAASHVALAAVRYVIWWNKAVGVGVMAPLTLTEQQYKRMCDSLTEEKTNHFRPDDSQITQYKEYMSKTRQGWWSDLLPEGNMFGPNNRYFTSQATLGKNAHSKVTGHIGVSEPVRALGAAIFNLTYTAHKRPFAALITYVGILSYNIIHLTSWNWHYPSPTEQWMWRCSLGFTVAPIALIGLVALPVCLGQVIWIRAKKQKSTMNRWWTRCLLRVCLAEFWFHIYMFLVRLYGIAATIGVAPWLLARFFILVESFISVRSVVKGTYTVVNWTTFIPHL